MKIFSDRLEIFYITPPTTGVSESIANSIKTAFSKLKLIKVVHKKLY